MSSWPAISATRSADRMVTAVVFDVMDTLLHDPYREAHEVATGLTFEAFEAVRPEGVYHALERSEIDEPAYWRALLDAGVSVDVHRFHAIRRGGYEWLPGMRELLHETAARHRVILASNYPAAWIADVRFRFFRKPHVELCASCDLGVRKPSPDFFHRMEHRFDLEPATTMFVDDSEANIGGAVAAGWQGILFRDARTTREALGALGILDEVADREPSRATPAPQVD
jgi:FMN hydrolase / 5-amino-6-(5-phospho-D-ribitylamino)uracil phosphatase